MRLRAVLFDAAGTLIETRESVGATYARLAAEHGAAISPWRLGEAFGRAMAAAPPLAFPDAAPDEIDALEREWWRERVRTTFLSADSAVRPQDFDACFEALFRHFGSDSAWRLRPGAREMLESLSRRGLRLAVVSNFDRRLRPLLAALGIANHFELTVLPSDCGFAKPDAAIFAHALAALQLVPAEAVFVGDDAERDLAGARALGMHAIDVHTLATLDELASRMGDRDEQSPAAN